MAGPDNRFNYSASLVSGQNFVQTPFIIVTIGEYTFGTCTKTRKGQVLKVTYPNYMDKLRVTKVNGAVNVYELDMTYAISNTDDPNLLDKVFSSISKSREITISYGDWALPNYIFKEEKALISNISTNVDIKSSTIQYHLKCVSTSLALQSGVYNFPAYKNKKPSEIILDILYRKTYGLTELFSGMTDKETVLRNGFIATDDKPVDIPAKNSTNILDYLSYLVSYMACTNDKSSGDLRDSMYVWYICDDKFGEFGGNYFKVVRVDARTTNLKLFNAYEIDIGFPSANNVLNFTVNQDDSWAILYDYSKKIQMPEYTYSINNSGEIVENHSPVVTNSGKYLMTTEADKTWWTKMTQFPIQATLTIEGLLRPATLMTYVKVNVYFFSKKHVSSGLYIITKQVDEIGSSGYLTTLSLTRIQGDEDAVDTTQIGGGGINVPKQIDRILL